MKKWIVGVALIVSALAGALVTLLDGDPNTNPNIGGVLDAVQQGVETIKTEPKTDSNQTTKP